jgi:hypothetical protein
MRHELLMLPWLSLPLACTYVQVFEVPNDEGAAGAASESCVLDGTCEPLVLASEQGDSSGGAYYSPAGEPLAGPDEIATDGQFVYWINLGGEIMRVPATGGETTRVALVEAPVALVVDDVYVFVSSAATATIWRAAKAGGAATELTSPAPEHEVSLQLAQTPELLLYNSGTAVYACSKPDCAEPRALWSAQMGKVSEYLSGLAVAQDRVYFGDMMITGPSEDQGNSSGTVNSIDLDGAGNAVVASGFESYQLVSTDRESLYATAAHAVLRAPLQGSAAQKILASGDGVDPWRLIAADGYVYWTELFPPGRVLRVEDLDASAPLAISPATTGARGITASASAIFWTTGDGRVLKLPRLTRPQPPK